MNTETKILGIIGVITIATLGIGIFFLTKNAAVTTPEVLSAETVNIDYSKGEKIGSDSAKVRLVEFADFQCPSCAAAEPAVKTVINSHPENFQYIFRYFPLAQHKNAMPAANLAKFAATKDRFQEISQKLYETQAQWESLPDLKDFFASLASDAGLNKDEAKEAVSKQSYKDLIQADINEGVTIGVDSTPTFYLNGHKLNVTNFSDINRLVDQELMK